MVQTLWNKIKKGVFGDALAYQGFGLSHRGRRRDHNEDAFFVSDTLGLYLVADGMGGHAHGEVASGLAVKSVSEKFARFGKMPSLKEAITEANSRIYRQSEETTPLEGREIAMTRMGTTIVALSISGDRAFIAHVGDSRVYRFRNDRLERLTRDHSLGEMGGEFGEPSDTIVSVKLEGRFKHVITRALGLETDVEVDMREEILQKGDLFLLCSDGLSNMVPDRQIAGILSAREINPSTCEALIHIANKNGGYDNISCVLVHYG